MRPRFDSKNNISYDINYSLLNLAFEHFFNAKITYGEKEIDNATDAEVISWYEQHNDANDKYKWVADAANSIQGNDELKNDIIELKDALAGLGQLRSSNAEAGQQLIDRACASLEKLNAIRDQLNAYHEGTQYKHTLDPEMQALSAFLNGAEVVSADFENMAMKDVYEKSKVASDEYFKEEEKLSAAVVELSDRGNRYYMHVTDADKLYKEYDNLANTFSDIQTNASKEKDENLAYNNFDRKYVKDITDVSKKIEGMLAKEQAFYKRLDSWGSNNPYRKALDEANEKIETINRLRAERDRLRREELEPIQDKYIDASEEISLNKQNRKADRERQSELLQGIPEELREEFEQEMDIYEDLNSSIVSHSEIIMSSFITANELGNSFFADPSKAMDLLAAESEKYEYGSKEFNLYNNAKSAYDSMRDCMVYFTKPEPASMAILSEERQRIW